MHNIPQSVPKACVDSTVMVPKSFPPIMVLSWWRKGKGSVYFHTLKLLLLAACSSRTYLKDTKPLVVGCFDVVHAQPELGTEHGCVAVGTGVGVRCRVERAEMLLRSPHVGSTAKL